MGYGTKVARSFSRTEPQTLGFAAVAVCFVVSLMLFTVLDPYMMNPLMSLLQQQQQQQRKGSRHSPGLNTTAFKAEGPPGKNNDLSSSLDANSSSTFKKLGGEKLLATKRPICDVSDHRADVCETKGDTRIHGGKYPSIIYYDDEQHPSVAKRQTNESWRIRPYARKGDDMAMGLVKEVLVARSSSSATNHSTCTANNTSNATAAVVFSVAGYTGNLFHDFTDVIVPLFLTSREFDGQVKFLVTDSKPWWVAKYRTLLRGLSQYEIVDLDRDSTDTLHCFRHVIVGLRCHKELTIVPSRSPKGYSMPDFTKFLRATYSLQRESVPNKHQQRQKQLMSPQKRRRLLIISRKRTRRFLNIDEIIHLAERVGYEVVVLEPTVSSSVATLARTINSCDVMVGVHGAGLTNLVFLPAKAVVVQVVPWGGLEWIGRVDFGEPAKDMGLRYLEYRIKPEESSLVEKYPRDHPVFRDPFSFHRRGWNGVREAFLDKQDVRVDVGRFRQVLVKALNLLRH